MNIIEQIKAEIERRIKEDYNGPDPDENEIAQGACASILAFLDTLPKENPSESWIERVKKELQHEEELLEMRLDTLRRIRDKKNQFQQEQLCVDLEKTVEFECIGKKVRMTIQELINYYIDTECANVADECGF